MNRNSLNLLTVFNVQIVLSATRTIIALIFLLYASWSDYKTREVSNSVWILYAPPAFTLTIIELFFYGDQSDMLFYGVSFGLTAAFSIILFYSGGFGGADAKALMCLALALPFYPQNLFTPLFGEVSPISQMFFPFTVFSNSVLLAVLMAVSLLLINTKERLTGKRLFDEGLNHETFWRKLLVLITGSKVSLDELKAKWYVYPLEDVDYLRESPKRRLSIIPKDDDRDAMVERLEKAVQDGIIEDGVWATRGLPMLIFITLGLLIALVFGDVIWIFVRSLLG